MLAAFITPGKNRTKSWNNRCTVPRTLANFWDIPVYDFIKMIMQKMVDQGRSDLDVVSTMILCGANFYLVRYKAHIYN